MSYPVYNPIPTSMSNMDMGYTEQPTYTQLSTSHGQTPYQQSYLQRPMPEYNNHYNIPRCQLNCKCCATQQTFGLVCPCNLSKESVATQTDNFVLNATAEDYFTPKTTAYRVLQTEIISTLNSKKLGSTSDKDFEESVTKVINFIGDLSDTPRTREKVRKRFRKRMYNQNGYEKTRELAKKTGGSVRKLQYKKQRQAVLGMIPEKQPRTSIIHTNVELSLSPLQSPSTPPSPVQSASSPSTPRPDISAVSVPSSSLPESSPTPSMSSPGQSTAVGFSVGDTVCIGSSKVSFHFAVVKRFWKTRVDVTYLKKSGNTLNIWKLGGGKPLY